MKSLSFSAVRLYAEKTFRPPAAAAAINEYIIKK